MRKVGQIVLSAAWVACSSIAQDYSIEFRTIGAPGNAPASPDEFPFLAINGIGPVGRVDYTYRMAKTELTVAQYFEFVQTYSPLNPGVGFKPGFFGSFIHNVSGDSNIRPSLWREPEEPSTFTRSHVTARMPVRILLASRCVRDEFTLGSARWRERLGRSAAQSAGTHRPLAQARSSSMSSAMVTLSGGELRSASRTSAVGSSRFWLYAV
jgi:hypothetical protein